MSEEKMKEWLNRGFHAQREADALKEFAEQCRQRAEGLSAVSGHNDTGKSDGTVNRTQIALDKLLEASEKAEQQIVKTVEITDEIKSVIDKLEESDLRTVLYHRYILFHSQEKTAEIMGYSVESVKKKQKDALKKITPFYTFLP